MGLLLGGGGRTGQRTKTLCQICANLIVTSWHLAAQHATSISTSLIKIRVNKLHPCFRSRGSEVQILSLRPFKIMGYGLGRSPFLLWLALVPSVCLCFNVFFPHTLLIPTG